MARIEMQDSRLLQSRLLRGELSRKEADRLLADLPDLSDRLQRLSEEELKAFAESLALERTERNERIERFLREPREVAPPPPPVFTVETEI